MGEATIRVVQLHTERRHIAKNNRLICNLQEISTEADRTGDVVSCPRCWEAAGWHLSDEEKHMAALAMAGL